MPIEKIRPSFTFDEERLKELARLAPEAFVDGKVNWETLKEALGNFTEDDGVEAEHFGLFWPGKRDARRKTAIPSKGTLVPVPGEGVNEDTTRNIFIEGENLEVLKLLQKSYSGRIKMIYIDPPYNTGKDFIYNDDFTEPLAEYLRRIGQIDDEGKLLSTNTRADGRFHSKWLSMMYPRLRLARNLLRDDGIIFVSIGDNELNHLLSIMDEIFGHENFVATFIWNTDGHTDNQLEVKINHEYIVCFQKDCSIESLNDVVDPNTRTESNLLKGFAENSITKNGEGNPPSFVTLKKGFPCKVKDLSLSKSEVSPEFFDEVETMGYITREITKKYNVEYPIRMGTMNIKNHKLENDCQVFTGWSNVNKLKKYMESDFSEIEEEAGNMSFYLSANGVVYYYRKRESAKNILSVLKGFMTTEKMRSTLEDKGVYFSYPKPVDLIKYLCEIGLTENDVVLDFFCGSGTTGHAIYEFNKRTGSNSKFILVQLPEPVKTSTIAYQKGFKSITEISKKRLKLYNEELDGSGFKVNKLSASSYKSWKNYEGKNLIELEQQFDLFNNPLVDDWKEENLLSEILLIEGYPLDSLIEQVAAYSENKVQKVSSDFYDHCMLVCLDKKVQDETIQQLQLNDGDVFVCLDSAITDQDKVRLSDKGLIKTI